MSSIVFFPPTNNPLYLDYNDKNKDNQQIIMLEKLKAHNGLWLSLNNNLIVAIDSCKLINGFTRAALMKTILQLSSEHYCHAV